MVVGCGDEIGGSLILDCSVGVLTAVSKRLLVSSSQQPRRSYSLASVRHSDHVGGRNLCPRELWASESRVWITSSNIPQMSYPNPVRLNAAYPLLHIDTLNNALPSSTRKDAVDPALHVPDLVPMESRVLAVM